MFDFDGNPNHTIDNFFNATHMFPMPIRDIKSTMNKSTRRVLVKWMGPVNVYEPLTQIPAITNTTFMYQPLLSSCYHKCPEQCPDIYSPVCGSRPTNTLLPGFMFKNHCYMDAASCYIHFNKYNLFDNGKVYPPPTYIETTWLFCIGDQTASAVSRLLPALRVLQHLGRIKKRRKTFHYQFRNMRNFNELHKHHQILIGVQYPKGKNGAGLNKTAVRPSPGCVHDT
ncbi:uncharacterized protein LOC126379773 [Pectinophora gossypiella]|uniref:uncharacterized protein LOC126379773 n=1 Tax=Pectinophora gossypiella TaxID=13191 RepID=UPI00214DF6CD|nr:uncharacterized protein LOC126379773 [Pectinophora gossypiella]